MKKIGVSILLILWLGVIFCFSNQSSTESLHVSDKLAEKIITMIRKDIPTERKQQLVKKTRVFIRKTTHFFEYFVLGILILLILYNYNVKYYLKASILLCFLFACSDELHQLFSIGRTARVLDTLIDTSGSILGIILVGKIVKKKEISYNKDKKREVLE